MAAVTMATASQFPGDGSIGASGTPSVWSWRWWQHKWRCPEVRGRIGYSFTQLLQGIILTTILTAVQFSGHFLTLGISPSSYSEQLKAFQKVSFSVSQPVYLCCLQLRALTNKTIYFFNMCRATSRLQIIIT